MPGIAHPLTFPLAVAGLAGLAAAVLFSVRGRLPRWLPALNALIIAVHVLLVWTTRYEWRLSIATRNGWTGFLIFHAAVATVLASALLRGRAQILLIRASFVIATLGSIGALWRYDEVSIYRWPVLACGLAGSAGLWLAGRRRGIS